MRQRTPRRPLTLVVVVAVLTALVVTSSPARATSPRPAPSSKAAAKPTAKPAEPPSEELVAARKARKTGRRVEVTNKRTETTRTFVNPDGTRTSEIAAGPVRMRDAQGAWRDIDTTLVADAAGVHPRVAMASLRLSPGGQGPLAKLDVDGKTVTQTLAGVRLPTPTLRGATATYQNVTPGVDLVVQARPAGFELSLVLTQRPPVAPTWTVLLGLSGLRVSQDSSGGLHVADATGRQVLVSDAPMMWDAQTDPATGVGRHHAAVTTRLAGDAGGGQVLEISPDPAFLSDPAVVYPVTIDPSTSIVRDASIDTFVQSDLTTAQGGVTELRAGRINNVDAKTYLTFDTAVVTGKHVNSARVDIYQMSAPSCTPVTMDVRALTSGFNNATVWANRPSENPTIYGQATTGHGGPAGTACANGDWVSFPVTGLIQGWADGSITKYGLTIYAHNMGVNGNYARFWSVDHASGVPKLLVTYSSDEVQVQDPPRLVHATGAELEWTRYQGLTGLPFDRYEVHRSTQAGFTPVSSGPGSTLLATIRDVDTTSWRDTTAAPSRTFYYKVVANTWVSNQLTVAMPAAQTARLTLQPDAQAGKATYLVQDRVAPADSPCYDWLNYGAAGTLRVGTASNGVVHRPLLAFDLRDIPVNAAVSAAALTVWYPSSGAPTNSTGREIKLHRVTRAWEEGRGTFPGQCDGSGAAWPETQGGVRWSAGGADIDTTADATVGPKSHSTANGQPGSDVFTVTALVQEWANATAPNHGMLLKLNNEAVPADSPYFDYYSDDAADPSLRPKLTVTYTDESASVAPRISLNAPAAGATVSGTAVPLTAKAADDGRVDRVEFLVDGVVKTTDTTPPFAATWDSTTATKGTHTITARATDDAGNPPVTSSPVTVTVDNTAGPTGSLTAPAAGAVVAGTAVTLSASASGTGDPVRQVEFLVDGDRVGDPDTTSSPYSVSWNTLAPLQPAFDGAHQVQALITETSGQQFRTEATTVTVDNRTTSQYRAKLELNVRNADPTDDGVVPEWMPDNTTASEVQDPYAGTINPDGTSGGSLGRSITSAPHDSAGPTPPCPADAYCPTVTIKNESGVAWRNSTGLDLRVWYRWYAPNGATLFEGPANDRFPNNFPDQAVQDFPLVIQPPPLPPGAELGAYRLRIDLYDVPTGTWFAAKGNPPVDRPVLVAKKLEDRLGLERFWQYDGEDAGAGMTTLANAANGNMLWRWSPLFAPGRGLSTMVDLTYNSLEDHSKSPAGNNVSLAISGLTRLGEPLDIHPNKADQVNNKTSKWVELVDGDGTTHTFTAGVTGADGITRFTEPPGVNLYLRSIPTNPDARRWALTRPDKVTFFYDTDGFPTAITDRNGNTLGFTLQDTPAGEDPGGPKKRITRVTDPAGMAGVPDRDFTIDYWSRDEAKKAHVRGKIRRISDHDGSALDFDYYDDGNLLRLTQRGGTTANGSFLADRSFVFTYTTSSGDGPAIADPALRADPEPRTPNQSTRLFGVRDPRGNETTFAYYGPSEGAQLRWKLKTRTNRIGNTPENRGLNPNPHTTSFAYDLVNRVTTVTAPPLSAPRVTRYAYDTDGKVTRITDPLGQPTQVAWTPDFKVSKVTEPKGVATPSVPDDFTTTYTYNANGYLTSRQNQITTRVERTELTYTDSPVDAADAGNHLSLLATVTSPKGVATPAAGDFQWRYSYDPAGNPDLVTDPTNAVTDYDYNQAGSANPGTVAKVTDPNGNNTTSDPTDGITTFPCYDPSGQPCEIRDPLGNSTTFGYDPDGHVTWIQDPNHAADTGDPREFRTWLDYDAFGRLGQQSAPKSTRLEGGRLIWSGVDYDPNDNLVRRSDPHYGSASGDPGNGPASTATYDAMDQPTELANPENERTGLVWDDAGRLRRQIAPKGVVSATADDFTALVEYDPLDRVVRQTQFGTGPSDKRITHLCYDTAGDLRSVTAPRAGLATVTCPGDGPLGGVEFTSSFDYDDAHRPVASRDPLGHESRTSYDANGNVATQERDIATGRVAKTTTDYDQRDAPITITQRLDGAADRNLTSRIEYDPNGNHTRVISPRANDAAGGTAPFTSYVTAFTYDAANRLTRITLPFDARDGAERQYVHRAYDPSGNLLRASLPVTAADPASVADTARTVASYFDPGWIRSSDDPANPRVRFDYTALGQQAERTPERKDAPGTLDTAKRMTWAYWDDGLLKQRTDQGGQAATYDYDDNNNLSSAHSAAGLTDPGEQPVDTQVTYTGFDQLAKVRHKKPAEANWTFTRYTAYDRDGNLTERLDDGQEDNAGTVLPTPVARRNTFAYDQADWVTEQLDLGTDDSCAGDQHIATSFFATGWNQQREVRRGAVGCTNPDPLSWPKKQTTTWTQFDNGLPRTLETVDGAGEVTESHQVGYTDDTGIYVNGHRTSDRYVLKRGQGSTATTCVPPTAPCDAKYGYDARDRLVSHQLRANKTNTYAYDQLANLLGDQSIRAGTITSQSENGVTTTRKYTAQQLTEQTTNGVTGKYWYDTLGNLDCVTTAAGTQADCSPSDGTTASANLVADQAYDYLNRLAGLRYFAAGSRTDKTDYTYDALDRTTREVEDHAGTATDRATTFGFQGLTNLVTQEQQTGGTNPKTKTYAYDAFGRRLTMDSVPTGGGTPERFTYGYDVHGSVSQLLDDANNVRASYGYSAFGGTDSTDSQSLTSGDTDPQAPLNPYRYTGRRMDSGTVASTTPVVPAGAGGYDMGARRFGPDLGAFLQQDQYYGALADLGLALDPLTQNRYALAGGNPVSYVEWDGHAPTVDNPVSANPTLNVQLNATKLPATNSPWSGKDRFVGCACAGLDQQVQAANQAQQHGSVAGVVGKFFGGAWDYAAGFVGSYFETADMGVPGPNDVGGCCGPVIRGRYVAPQDGPSYTDVHEQQVRRWGVNTSSASYTAGEIVGFPAFGGLTAAGVKVGARVGAKAAARRLATRAAEGELVDAADLPGYRSFRAARRNLGPAGPGRVYDHVVEQSQIGRSGFAAEEIHHPFNLDPVDASINQLKADYYARIRPFTGGQTVRNWLNGQSFADQYEFGMDILGRLQNGLPLP